MSNYKYYPLIKTRDAELRCFAHLDPSLLDEILPIYELTKSRTTKKVPDGDIYRRMKQIHEIQGERPFILDLSTDERYINPQIKQLLSERNGFLDWQYFILDIHGSMNIIPMIHLYEDDEGNFVEVESFVKTVSKVRQKLAVRLPHDLDEEDIEYYLSPVFNSLHEEAKVIIVFDAGYIRDAAKVSIEDIVNNFVASCRSVQGFNDKIDDVVIISTSFPSSVATEGGEDAEGDFEIYEEKVFMAVSDEVDDVKYGDYASINTEQIEMKGGTFVPRIDIASQDGNSFFYKRFRRNDGSYPRCAKAVIDDHRYKNLKSWADDEISLASNGDPSGISPSYWISVRMNYYIMTRFNLRASG